MMLIICSLISALTQKEFLRAVNGQVSPERAATCATLPVTLMNTHFSLADFTRGEKKGWQKKVAAMVTDSFSPLFFPLPLFLLSLSISPPPELTTALICTHAVWQVELLKCDDTWDPARLYPLCWCSAAGVLLPVWIQLGLCCLCERCACCSLIRTRLCLKCLSWKPLQYWLRLRV